MEADNHCPVAKILHVLGLLSCLPHEVVGAVEHQHPELWGLALLKPTARMSRRFGVHTTIVIYYHLVND